MIRAKAAAVAALTCLLVARSWADGTGLSAVGETKVDGKTWTVFTAPEGIKVLAAAPMPEGALPRLERAMEIFGSWTSITPTEVRVDFGQEEDEYVVLVSNVASGTMDYAKNIPAGIRLRFSGAFLYDFRVKSGDYFVRVRGVLMGDKFLASEIAKAASDPAAYIAERDPAWAAGRIGELESTIESSASAIEILRAALAAQFNRGFFGGPRPVPQTVVDLVKELKKEKPETDRAAVAAAAKERGVKASAKEIDAVFRAWFGE